MMPAMIEISVVVPVYACAECLQPLRDRLVSVLEKMGLTFEVIFIEDCGPDDSWTRLKALAADDTRITAVRLSRNFGQHAAITAGLDRAQGKWAVVMDCDLEDPPESIPRLYQAATEGKDIVFGRRVVRQRSWLKELTGKLYYGLLAIHSQQRLDPAVGTFSLISRRVIDAFLRVGDYDRHYLLILGWLGFDPGYIDYEQQPRYAGKSSYGVRKLFSGALAGIFFQTTTLLHWMVYVGLLCASAGFVLAAYYVYQALRHSIGVQGWATVVVLQLVIGGIIIASVGVASLYIGRIFQQVKGRPMYVVGQETEGKRDDGASETVSTIGATMMS